MRYVLFGVVVSTVTVIATSSFAAWAECAAGYKASPKMINGSEDYGQSYTCTGSKAAPKLVCSSAFSPQASSGGEMAMSTNGDKISYTCAQPATPPK